MKSILPLFVFIDACGWEIIKDDPFAKKVAPHRKRLESVFGYSSACVPSILSGNWPDQHRNWCYFVYDPKNSPFKSLKSLQWLPKAITGRRIFRRWLSKFVRAQMKFRGYFDLYNIPFKYISMFDFTEKKNPLQPKGMNRGPNIFDWLVERDIAYHVSAPTTNESGNLDNLITDIKSEKIDFAFLYWPNLDGLLHQVGNKSPEIPAKLRSYEPMIDQLLAAAHEHYDEVKLYIFSDHGMANCDELLDLKSKIDALDLKMGKDYAVVYDSTMARFWFFDPIAERKVRECLHQVPQGRILSDAELIQMRAYFSDGYFGEMIFLVKEGVLIVPSHMGERPIRAMHGYHPEDPQSYASLMTNQNIIPENITAIPDIFRLMTRDAAEAKIANTPGYFEKSESNRAEAGKNLVGEHLH